MNIIKQIEAYFLYLTNNKYNPRFKKFKESFLSEPIDKFYDYYLENKTSELEFYHDLLSFVYNRKDFLNTYYTQSIIKKIIN